jgi:shikimate kinase
MYTKKNITLIGMPASGKSTVGVLLAKRIGYKFIDTDLVIQEQEGKLLKEIIAEKGMDGYLAIENQVNRDIVANRAVIAPGGSVIYCEEAMEHFRQISCVIYLKISYESLKKRLGDLIDRGVVLKDGMTLKDLYQERCQLYEKYADIFIDEEDMKTGQVVDKIRGLIENWENTSVGKNKSYK